ncbi:MAG: hypothetical protein IPP37_20320 [Saprospiraceae bacterium]|nr:hypothetical protein [Saprospiraceae bacterium]
MSGYVPFPESGDWVRSVGFSSKTLQRYKASVTISVHPSEKIRDGEVTLYGQRESLVLKNCSGSTLPLCPGSYKPKELLFSSYGKEMVWVSSPAFTTASLYRWRFSIEQGPVLLTNSLE